MMQTFRNVVGAIVVCILFFLAGFFGREYFYPTEPIVEWKTKIQTEIVYRDYPKLSLPDCVERLKCYDTSLPVLDYKRLDAWTYRIGAGLCDRTWSRDLSIEVGEGGNWKYAVGAGIAVAGIVGIMAATGALK